MPEAVDQALPILSKCSRPFGAYANGFTSITDAFKYDEANVKSLDSRKDLDPQTYAQFTDAWIKLGASIIGGCCEVGPQHIAEIKARQTKQQ